MDHLGPIGPPPLRGALILEKERVGDGTYKRGRRRDETKLCMEKCRCCNFYFQQI